MPAKDSNRFHRDGRAGTVSVPPVSVKEKTGKISEVEMIIACEPQCVGFEHVEVNTALLEVISFAYPDERIVFYGEKAHIEHIKHNSEELRLNFTNIHLFPIVVPPRNFSNPRRLNGELKLIRKIRSIAKNNNARRIIFTSVTSPGLMAMKLLFSRGKDPRCIVVLHGVLETISRRPPVLPWNALFWLKPIMAKHNDRICYIVLGPSIKKELKRLLPTLSSIVALDLPYFFKPCPGLSADSLEGSVTFGSFGVGSKNKGTDTYFRLSREIGLHKNRYDPRFILIGPVADPEILKGIPGSVHIPSLSEPLGRDQYDSYAAGIDYAIYCYDREAYRLTASAAFFDALSYVKPIIAIRNPFFEYYFERMGDIGYLCEDYEDLKKVVLDLLNNRSADRYAAQQKNILDGRRQFDHCRMARQMKKELEAAM